MNLAQKITVPAVLTSLKEVQSFLEMALPKEYQAQLNAVRLVAEELLINVVNYSYDKDAPKKDVTVFLGNAELEGEEKLLLAIEHQGVYFDPFKEVPTPNLDLEIGDRPIGGLGVFFVKEFSDAQFCTTDGVTVTLRAYFGKTPKVIS